MNANARIARMVRECSLSESAFNATLSVVIVVAVFAAASPSQHSGTPLAGSPIDARAAAPAAAPGRMPAPQAGATDGNVADLTY